MCVRVFGVRIGSWVCMCVSVQVGGCMSCVLTEVWVGGGDGGARTGEGGLIGTLLVGTGAQQEPLLLYKVTRTDTHLAAHYDKRAWQ